MSSDHQAPIPVLPARGEILAAFLVLGLLVGGGAALGARATGSLVLQVGIGLACALAGLAAFGVILSRNGSRSLRHLTAEAVGQQREICSRRLALASQAVAAVARGDPPPPAAQGELDDLRPGLDALAESDARWNRDLDALVAAILAGRLDQRIDPGGYQGRHAHVLQGVNAALDALVTPLQRAAMCVSRLSRGDVPAPLTDAWPGELDFLRTGLNACSAGLGGVFRDLIEMTTWHAVGEIDARIDEQRHQGAFRQLAAGVNAAVRVHVEVMLQLLDILAAYAAGDFGPVLERLPGKQAIINERLDLLRTNLQGVAEQMHAITGAAVEGRLSARADATRLRGDWAALLSELNATLEALAAPVDEATRVLEQLAGRDLRARMIAEYRGDHARIRDALNVTAQALHDALAQVAGSTEQLSGAATQIASSSQAVASGASEQAAALQETSSALESVAHLAQEATAGTHQADGLAVSARAAATEGTAAVEQLQGTMRRIRQAAEGTSQIIRDVTDIAFQTNLLALNAAVEAARAGENGRGFAVVAEEVRSLALRAKEAARKTEDLIRQSVGEAAQGEAAAAAVTGRLAEIVDGVAKVTAVVGEIAQAAEAQSLRIGEVNRTIGEISRVTQQNAASAEESSSSSSELSAQAEELAAMVASFRLGESPAAAPRPGGGLARRGGARR